MPTKTIKKPVTKRTFKPAIRKPVSKKPDQRRAKPTTKQVSVVNVDGELLARALTALHQSLISVIDHPENNVFEVTRTYASRGSDPDDDGIEWRLSMTSATATCTTARRAVAAPGSRPFWEKPVPPPPGEPPEPEGAGSPINVRKVNGKDETGGVEIQVPSLKLTLGFECEASIWRILRPRLLRVPRGSVNAETFQLFPPGELLFSGFDSQRIENGEKYRLSYTFDVSPTEDFTAGDFTITDAPGWSAKWSYWGSEEEVEVPVDPDNPSGEARTIIRPKCDGAYASEVYGRMDFNTLLPQAVADELDP